MFLFALCALLLIVSVELMRYMHISNKHARVGNGIMLFLTWVTCLDVTLMAAVA